MDYSQDSVAQYLSPSKREFESTLKAGLQAQLSEAHAADLLFQVADFAAAAWCYKVPEELVGLHDEQHAYAAHMTVTQLLHVTLVTYICSRYKLQARSLLKCLTAKRMKVMAQNLSSLRRQSMSSKWSLCWYCAADSLLVCVRMKCIMGLPIECQDLQSYCPHLKQHNDLVCIQVAMQVAVQVAMQVAMQVAIMHMQQSNMCVECVPAASDHMRIPNAYNWCCAV